jgi:hypothetical protein
MACYSYFYLQGYRFAKKIVTENVKDSLIKIARMLKRFLLLQKQIDRPSKIFMEGISRTRGFLVGALYSILEPIN